jgi:hypothetical protein
LLNAGPKVYFRPRLKAMGVSFTVFAGRSLTVVVEPTSANREKNVIGCPLSDFRESGYGTTETYTERDIPRRTAS